MSKIRIEMTISSKENERNSILIGIKNNNSIMYNHEDEKVILNLNDNIELIKENKDTIINLPFKQNEETKGSITLKETRTSLILTVYAEKIIINKNNILIKYKIMETEEYITYSLMYEVIENDFN